MKSIRKSLATLLVAGGLTGAYFVGSTLVKDVQFARAEQQVESTREQLASVEDLATVFRNVGKVVEPSVVNITVRKGPTAGGAHPDIPDDMLRRFFPDRDGDGKPDVPEGFEERFGEGFEQMGTGSGVIIGPRGAQES